MPNIPASVGHFTITGRLTVGGADSIDADEFPDALGANGTVRFTPQLPDERPVVAVAEEEAVAIVSVPCRLEDGYIHPPADGLNATDETGTPGVRLIASVQESLQPGDWWWLAEFTPDPGERWKPFPLYFQTRPGDDLTIAQLIMQSQPFPSATVYHQKWYPVPAFPTDPVELADLPAGFRPGVDILLNTTTKEYAEVY